MLLLKQITIYIFEVDIEYPFICKLQSLSITQSPGIEDRSILIVDPSEIPRTYT